MLLTPLSFYYLVFFGICRFLLEKPRSFAWEVANPVPPVLLSFAAAVRTFWTKRNVPFTTPSVFRRPLWSTPVVSTEVDAPKSSWATPSTKPSDKHPVRKPWPWPRLARPYCSYLRLLPIMVDTMRQNWSRNCERHMQRGTPAMDSIWPMEQSGTCTKWKSWKVTGVNCKYWRVLQKQPKWSCESMILSNVRPVKERKWCRATERTK